MNNNMNNNIIPIVMALDDNYSMPISVAIISALENKSQNTFYKFYLLIPSEFNEENKEKISSIKDRYTQCEIFFINYPELFSSYQKFIIQDFINYSCLLLTEIEDFNKYQRIIYFKGSILVKKDLYDLYSQELQNNFCAGVIDPMYYINKNSIKQYVNTNVLLVNLEEHRFNDSYIKKMIQKKIENSNNAEEIVNLVYYKKIKFLPNNYNVMLHSLEALNNKRINEIYNYEDFYKTFKDPIVIQFTSFENTDLNYSLFTEEQQKYYQLSPFYKNRQLYTQETIDVQPLVSVAIITRNRKDLLNQTITSILKQSYRNFELIIVDDYSDDETKQLLYYYSLKDKRVRILFNTECKGISFCRNKINKAAQGKYIAVNDDDDISYENRLEVQVNYMEKNPEITLLATDFDIIENNKINNSSKWTESFDHKAAQLMLTINNFICHSTVMYRKAFLEKCNISYNEKYTYTEDYNLYYQILKYGGKIEAINKKTIFYKKHSANVTKNYWSEMQHFKNLVQLNFLMRFTTKDISKSIIDNYISNPMGNEGRYNTIKKIDTKNYFLSSAYQKVDEILFNTPYPIKDKESIPIIYACDKNYINYTLVSIHSVIKNSKSNVFLNFFIIYCDISNETINKIIKIFKYENATIKFIDVRKIINSYGVNNFRISFHFTLSTYLRFFIPKIFKNFKKVIYLDPDTIVLEDIRKFYEIKTNSKVLTGAIALGAIRNDHIKYNREVLKLKDPRRYLQAGVMLIDVQEAIKDNFEEKCIAKLKEIGTPRYSDQDVLNALYGKDFNIIDTSWNIQWHIKIFNLSFLDGVNVIEYERVMSNPKIIHYTSNIKPWNSPQHEHADKWWYYARQTAFYEEILFDNIENKIAEKIKAQTISLSQKQILKKDLKRKRIKYYKYKILSKILFGSLKQKYKSKRKMLKLEIRNIKNKLG